MTTAVLEEQKLITVEDRIRWVREPVDWVREIIQPPKISLQQLDVLDGYKQLLTARLKRIAIENGAKHLTLTDEERRLCTLFGISIQSGKGTGKNAVVAWLMMHFMDNMPPPNIKLMWTAPTEEQLKNNLWAEIYKWMRKSPYLMEKFTHSSEKVYLNEHKGKAVFASWKTTSKSADPQDQAATLAGKHEDYMLLGIDEASAVADPVFRPIESTMTGMCNFAIVTFNPTRSKGYAIRTQNEDRRHWLAYHWDAEQSDVVDPLHVQRYAEKYGKDSNMYRINVRGLPPKIDADVLIPYGWVQEAIDLELDVDEDDWAVAGLDVAGGGSDSTVLCIGTGGKMQEIRKTNLLRKNEIADWVEDVWNTHDLQAIAVDVNGLGAGVGEELEDRGLLVLHVNVGREAEGFIELIDKKTPWTADKFERLRDELWFGMRVCFEKALIDLLNHEEMTGELTSIKYEQYKGTQAKIKVESKKEMRARGLKSPDTADACCLWNYARVHRGRSSRKSRHALSRRRPRTVNWRAV